MKGMKKDYYILNNDTGEFVCKLKSYGELVSFE